MKRKSSFVGIMFCVFLALMLVMVSCGKSASSTAPTSTVTTTAVSTATATTAPTSPSKRVPTGVFRYGAPDFGAQTFDPFTSSTVNDVAQMELVFDWLVGPTPDKSGLSTEIGLANKWETSPDGLTWTFYLRKGAMFDQGYGEVTAEDVKFSIERNIREGAKANYAAPLRAGIKSIDAVDPYIVRFNLNNPIVTLAYDLASLTGVEGTIYSKKYLDKVGDQEFALHPVGSGPYRLVKQEKGLSMVFEARDDYWAGAPKYKQIELRIVPEEATRVAMLKTGQLDVANVDVSSLKDLVAAGLKVTEQKGAVSVYGIPLDPTKGAFADVRVRQAINLAVNKQEMLSLFEGKADVLPLGGAFTWAVGANKSLGPAPYDPKRAKELLAQAGYSSGLEITLTVIPLIPTPIVAQAVGGYFEAVGIKTKLVSFDYPAWLQWMSAADKDHTNNLSVFPITNRPFPVALWQGMFSTGGRFPAASLKSPEFDALLAEAMKAKDVTQYGASVGKIQQYLHDNWTLVDMVQTSWNYVSSPKIDTTGWTAGGIGVNKQVVKQLAMMK